MDFAEFSVEPGRRRRQKRTILCVPNKVYDTNLQKFSTLGRFLVLTCLTLFITSFVPAAHAYQIISIIQAPSQINEGDSFTYRVRRTGSFGDLNYPPLEITLKIRTDNQINGFNYLVGGGATDSFEQTVSFGDEVRDVWKTVRTVNNTIVNDETQVIVGLKEQTDVVLQGNDLEVLIVDDDVYTLRVRLATAWQINESGNVQVRFERCVGKKNTEAITNCLDVTGPVRPGAITAPLTEEIFVEKKGNYFVGTNLFDTLQKTVDGQVVTVDAVSLGENVFSKTVTLTPVDDNLDEPNGSLIIRTFPNSELSDQRKVLIQIRDNDQTRVRVDRLGPHPVDEGATPAFVFKRYGTEYLSPATFKISLFYNDKLLADTTTRLAKLQNIRFPQGVTEVVYRPLTTEDDSINEGDGRVAVTIDDVNYDNISRGEINIVPYLGAPSSFAAFRVVDNDIPMVTLSLNTNSIVETESADWLLTRNDYEETRLGVSVEYELVKYYPDGLHPDQVTSFAGSLLYIPAGTLSEVFLVGGQNLVGPQGGYLRYRLLPFPTDKDREPLLWDDHPSFLPRYTVANSDWIQFDIANNNPGVEVEATQDSVTEGENARFTLERYGGAASIIQNYATRVRINVSQTGNYLPADELGVRTVTIPVGQRLATLTIPTNGANHVRSDGEVTVTILNGAPTEQTEDTYDFDERYSDFVQRYTFKSTVVILNDDEAGVTISPTTLYVREGASETYTVVLDDVMTPSRSSGDADVTVSGALGFTTDNWIDRADGDGERGRGPGFEQRHGGDWPRGQRR